MNKKLFAFFFVMILFSFSTNAFAVNSTAINEIQSDLSAELNFPNSFSVFWIVFLLILLAVFMATMLKMRENRETIFFSISAIIVSIMLMLLFTSPLDFDYQQTEKTVIVEEISWLDGNKTYNSAVTNNTFQTIVIPADSQFRSAMSALFTGTMIFNALYTLFILTNFNTKGRF